ncbi:hypothetical protein [Paenibacillus monticola]|uniref:Uncharacterized protein n=1 Tax=Paenibacillus monticola TaxID=2666075 RepID=A0A7X2L4U8_9BACL|nr:hypothetical protein [Paenibacillus monticola]MRN56859.1 hypothetical protein [Paenibacillus monticola]
MKKKYIAMLIVLFVLSLLCIQPGYVEADNGVVISSETKDRLTQQYGLDKPETSSWSGVDVGVSSSVQLFIIVSKVIVNPYVFVIQEFIHSLID